VGLLAGWLLSVVVENGNGMLLLLVVALCGGTLRHRHQPRDRRATKIHRPPKKDAMMLKMTKFSTVL